MLQLLFLLLLFLLLSLRRRESGTPRPLACGSVVFWLFFGGGSVLGREVVRGSATAKEKKGRKKVMVSRQKNHNLLFLPHLDDVERVHDDDGDERRARRSEDASPQGLANRGRS